MREIISVSPFRCRMWGEHERLQEYINEETCRDEIASFLEHGQLIPVLGRPLRGDPAYDYELIYGSRRLFVACHLNVQLRLEVRELSDRDAIIAMDIENRQRKEVSPYERGCSYLSWLRGGYFKSQDEMAQTLEVSASNVSRLLKLAQLPPVIVNAFESPFEICEAWGLDLHEAWQNPDQRRTVLKRARSLADQPDRVPAHKVFEVLLAGVERARRSGKNVRDEVVTGEGGEPLFRIRYQRRTISLLLPSEQISSNSLGRIKSFLVDSLQPSQAKASTVPINIAERRPVAQNFGPDTGVVRNEVLSFARLSD